MRRTPNSGTTGMRQSNTKVVSETIGENSRRTVATTTASSSSIVAKLTTLARANEAGASSTTGASKSG